MTNKYKFTEKYLKNETDLILKIDILAEIVSFFECRKCGKCCRKSSPNLLYSEYDKYKNHNVEMCWKDNNRVQIKGNPCPFLDNNVCKAQNNKPMLCKAFPLMTAQNSDCIVIWDCELGREILKEYNKFLDETNRDSDIEIDVETVLSPFFGFDADILNVTYFLFWLKKKNKIS